MNCSTLRLGLLKSTIRCAMHNDFNPFQFNLNENFISFFPIVDFYFACVCLVVFVAFSFAKLPLIGNFVRDFSIAVHKITDMYAMKMGYKMGDLNCKSFIKTKITFLDVRMWGAFRIFIFDTRRKFNGWNNIGAKTHILCRYFSVSFAHFFSFSHHH